MSCALAGPILLSLAILNVSPVWGQAAPDSVTEIIQAHTGWGVKTIPAGAKLSIRESSRSGKTIKYRLVTKDLPTNSTYTIVAWPSTVAAPVVVMTGVTLDASGLAICAGTPDTCKGDGPNDPIDLAFQPVQGEPLRLGLIGEGNNAALTAKIVPIPLRNEDRGCVIEAVLLTSGSEIVWIEGSGFPAETKIIFDSNSEGERRSQEGRADMDGWYGTAVLPYKQGVSKGTVKVQLKSDKCSPSVSVPWGKR